MAFAVNPVRTEKSEVRETDEGSKEQPDPGLYSFRLPQNQEVCNNFPSDIFGC